MFLNKKYKNCIKSYKKSLNHHAITTIKMSFLSVVEGELTSLCCHPESVVRGTLSLFRHFERSREISILSQTHCEDTDNKNRHTIQSINPELQIAHCIFE